MREALTRGRPWNGRLALPRPGERAAELEVVATTVTEPPGILITERDITREVLLQDQVRQAQKMEALGTLAGGIAHDFNNILGAIFINTELAILDTHDNCPAHDTLPLILKAAQRGKELVQQISAFSRRQAGPKSVVRLEPVVREALGLFRATLPSNVALEESIAAGGAIVQAHPSQVHQIISNLCQNAALAMGGRPGRLEVRLDTAVVDPDTAARHDGLEPGPYARLAVADSGCGMPPEVLDRVFEPFFTTRAPGEGSGLGLSVVHGIVKSCGGAITAYSEAGRGSTFNIFLPLVPENGETVEADLPADTEPGRERILLVDDDPGQLESFSRMLGRLGYTVTVRSSGPAAEAAFREGPEDFDLVITDQTMPGMTGTELARRLVALRPDVRIVLNTGFSQKVNGETVGRDGIRAFIMKPFTSREISRVIREALREGR
jgi:two-component system, cell cycle sensor histidine kinase and response regulator CckA